MNINKKYVVFIIIAFVVHITNAEEVNPTDDSNYSKKRIEKDYGKSLPLFLDSMRWGIGTDPANVSLAIEDKEEDDHVKVIVREITSNVLKVLPEQKDHAGSKIFYGIETNNEKIHVAYDKQTNFLFVVVFEQQVVVDKQEQEDQIETLYYKGSQENSIEKRLRSAIKLDRKKIDYDEKNQVLTINIPRVKSKQGDE